MKPDKEVSRRDLTTHTTISMPWGKARLILSYKLAGQALSAIHVAEATLGVDHAAARSVCEKLYNGGFSMWNDGRAEIEIRLHRISL